MSERAPIFSKSVRERRREARPCGRSKAAGNNPASFFCQVVNLRVIFLLMRNLPNVERLFSLGRLPNLAGIDAISCSLWTSDKFTVRTASSQDQRSR